MFDTYVTIVGNVLTAPEWRRTTQSGTLVANFKVASTARRLDRDSGRWVDGNSLRVRVNCWRRMAEGVASSVAVGDPVIVAGRLYTRDWTDESGTHRTLYELEAVAVGHDLSRGRARFLRNQPRAATSTVEDAEAEQRVHGETTEPVPDGQAPATFDDRPFDDDFPPPEYGGGRVGLVGTVERVGEPDPFDDRPGERGAADELSAEGDDEPVPDEDDELAETSGGDDPADSEPSASGPAASGPNGSGPSGGAASGRRGRRRTPVPA
ncbi:single-stranded DNA-binding protein [Micromonospora echinospora]|uniref:Single-stranded DNA-binding protein n=2 Tax=Micromonospora echinospora TaxID=1877 RepID=A0ABR6MKB1_MICEC|nr:single-stranded DNA-binding protein [Micromonospora echinospora]MBB5115814.1 single-strand DNA-binding protein [Micromonospora echinospora]